eukprot:730348-Pelagomonas_calceolata.AAC.1
MTQGLSHSIFIINGMADGEPENLKQFFFRLKCSVNFVFDAEASTGGTGPGFSCNDLLPLLISIATKFSHAFPVV